MLPPVPGDTRQGVQVRPALRLDDAGHCRSCAGKPRLCGHRNMLPAKRSAIAERIREMPHIALERGLCYRLAHCDFAQRIGLCQV